jgi:hypothetical protein
MREIDEEEALLLEITIPEEIDFDSHENLYEGAKKQVYVLNRMPSRKLCKGVQ